MIDRSGLERRSFTARKINAVSEGRSRREKRKGERNSMVSHRARAAAASLAVSVWLVMSAVMVVSQEEEMAGVGGDDCLYESSEACTRADAMGCVWCDLPRRCYSAARSLELGEFCNRKKFEAFVEVWTCDDVLEQEHCLRAENCLWCRSDEVDDGCFSEIEAVRLPKHIFSCPSASSASGTVRVSA